MEFTKYATFQPAEGSYGSFYMNNPNYTGKYILGNPWYDKDETIENTFSHNAAESKTYYQLKLDYARTFNDHDITAMVLLNRSNRSYDNRVALSLSGADSKSDIRFQNKYLAEFNIGYNGSENFAPGKRYGTFPAGSIGWVISGKIYEGTDKMVEQS